jgi:hypothetical protein
MFLDARGLHLTTDSAALINANLHAAKFDSKIITSGSHAATSRSNICNKGRRSPAGDNQGPAGRFHARSAIAKIGRLCRRRCQRYRGRLRSIGRLRGWRAAAPPGPEVSYNLHARRRLCRWGRYEAEMSINLMQRAVAAPRRAVRSKRTGKRCRAPAVRGWKVCRRRGARGGAPKGERNGNYKHGARSIAL